MKNEKLIRKESIDNHLKQADWNVTDQTQPNEPRWPKQGEKEIATDRRIYV